ncbi:MAG: hypothetical protein VX346_07880 [Planctomycetota bacterium]|nr:hypothetical protein [Planctomycetota bacterium]
MDRREFSRTTVAGIVAGTLMHPSAGSAKDAESIPALLPRDASGHRFVLYSDCCSGKPGTAVEKNLQSVNRMVARIQPQPEFIAFPGDAVNGYTQDYAELRQQWDYWRGIEMKWVREREIPLFQSTSNHNTYDAGSEQVFRDVHADLPQNGPPRQQGLAYWFRRGDLLYISTHQPDQRMPIDHAWLDQVLTDNADARYKFVAGHYPVFPVNGYVAWPLWCFPPDQRQAFWDLLVKHHVDAYLASHIIAFDCQAHEGVVQILSGGAGTAYGPGGFMPGRSEYFHAVQIAVDEQGLRYQVHDPTGEVRESLSWPFKLPPVEQWNSVHSRNADTLLNPIDFSSEIVAFRIRGILANRSGNANQTLLCGVDSGEGVEPLWIGVDGDSGRLLVRLVPLSGYGWQVWGGPSLAVDQPFDFQIVLHPGMGPGGILFRVEESAAWSTLDSTSSKGCEDLKRPQRWAVGHGQSGVADQPYQGDSIRVHVARKRRSFDTPE